MEIRYKYGINHAAALQMQRSLCMSYVYAAERGVWYR
jgi:hypothetical protein